MNDETDFDAYARLNRRLLGLILAGKGESAEADGVRDDMDKHWYNLTPREQSMMRKINETNLAD